MIQFKFAGRGLGLVILGVATMAQADPLVFDRGLPTTNLNNAAGANRSNVSWGDTPSWFLGDDFAISGSGAYNVSTIRTWIVGGNTPGQSLATLYSNLSLRLGPGGPNAMTSSYSSFTATQVQYANSTGYENPNGSFRDIWQVDWNTAGLVVNAGDVVNFGVSGATTAAGLSSLGYDNVVFLHSSNAPLSGSTQQGANGLMRGWENGSGNWSYDFDSSITGWDKNSDANIQVFAAPVPEPMTMLTLAGGLAFAAARRRRSAKK